MSRPHLSIPTQNKTREHVSAPISGVPLPLEAVPDPVFAQKIIGPGLAIDPTSTVLVAPCDGRVTQLHRAHHALTLTSVGGQQILLHIGIDTVTLKGEGFSCLVQEGQDVRRGQELIRFDAEILAQRAKSLITVILFPELTESKLHLAEFKPLVRAHLDTIAEFDMSDRIESPDNRAPTTPVHAVSEDVAVRLASGLHARPASLIVGLAKSYASQVNLVKDGKAANAKSVVGLMGLEVLSGNVVRFEATGPDAALAVRELAELLNDLNDRVEESQDLPSPWAAARPTPQDKDVLAGFGVSSGVAIGRIHRVRAVSFSFREQAQQNFADELNRLKSACAQAKAELHELASRLKTETDPGRAAIFAAHEELLEDPDLWKDAEKWLGQGKSAAFAWDLATRSHAERLAHLNNELMANRANDLRDVGQRVVAHLSETRETTPQEFAPETILIAENLTPSQTVLLDRSRVLGFCTTSGGATSHVAILARSLGLPAIAGIDERALDIADGTEVIIDGDSGEMRLRPTPIQKQAAEIEQRLQHERRQSAQRLAHKAAQTRDGRRIEVAANIGSVADAREAVAAGADGVGLLRSEFLFLERDSAPSEDEQLQVYQEIADVLENRTLVIRTLDVGGDKPLRYLPIPPEDNPFLGVRGIRMGFAHPQILREQLRAILRVRTKGKLCVMFPMISTIEEFRQAKSMLEEERTRLGAAKIEVGIMVEVPSVALNAELFAREVDFFSVGTNDLTQYTLAMDRGHAGLAKQVDALHPSVLRLIQMAADAAHAHGRWIGVCGGLAGDLVAVPLLIGLGIDELSVSVPSIALVKSSVRESAATEAKALAKTALQLESAQAVRDLKKFKPSEGYSHVTEQELVFVPAENR